MNIVGISADASMAAAYNGKTLQVFKTSALDKPQLSFSLPDTKVGGLTKA